MILHILNLTIEKFATYNAAGSFDQCYHIHSPMGSKGPNSLPNGGPKALRTGPSVILKKSRETA